METLCGDTSIGHATAYCEAIEGLERHCGSSPGAGAARNSARTRASRKSYRRPRSAGGRCRLSANRRVLRPDSRRLPQPDRGNLWKPLRPGNDQARRRVCSIWMRSSSLELTPRLEAALKDVEDAVRLMWDAPSVQARFRGHRRDSRQTCEALGLVGPAARACGVERDIRQDFPSGIFRFAQIPISKWDTGDVFARAWVRWLEIQRSGAFVREQLASLPEGPTRVGGGTATPRTPCRVSDRRMARRDLPRGNHRSQRAIRTLQGSRSVISQLDGTGDCDA